MASRSVAPAPKRPAPKRAAPPRRAPAKKSAPKKAPARASAPKKRAAPTRTSAKRPSTTRATRPTTRPAPTRAAAPTARTSASGAASAPAASRPSAATPPPGSPEARLAALPSYDSLRRGATELPKPLTPPEPRPLERFERARMLNDKNCMRHHPRRDFALDQPDLSMFRPARVDEAKLDRNLRRDFEQGAGGLDPAARADLADDYAKKLDGPPDDPLRTRRYWDKDHRPAAMEASDALRTREAARLERNPGAQDPAAAADRASDLRVRPMPAPAEAYAQGALRTPQNTLSMRDAELSVALSEHHRAADEAAYDRVGLKPGHEDLFVYPGQEKDLFDATPYTIDFDASRARMQALGSKNCMRHHDRPEPPDFDLSLRDFSAGSRQDRVRELLGRDTLGGSQSDLQRLLDPRAPAAPAAPADPIRGGIDKHLARTRPELRPGSPEHATEAKRLRAEHDQLARIRRDPKDLDARLRVPEDQMIPDQRRVYDEHGRAKLARDLGDHARPRLEALGKEYRDNEWGPDSPHFGADRDAFLSDLAKKDPAEISRYDAFRGLATLDGAELSPEQQKLQASLRGQAVSGIGDRVKGLDRHFDRMLADQGIVGDTADWLKNNWGSEDGWVLDSNLGSNAVAKTIGEAYAARRAVDGLKDFQGTHQEFLKAYEQRMGDLQGSLSDVQGHMRRFDDSQKAWVDGIADVASVTAAVGAAALAPVTGGASLAVGAAVGAGVRVGVKGLDAATGSGEYQGNVGVDLLKGGLNGLTGAGTNLLARKAAAHLTTRASAGLATGQALPWMTRAGIWGGTTVGEGAIDGYLSQAGGALIDGKGLGEANLEGLRGAAYGGVFAPAGAGAFEGLGRAWRGLRGAAPDAPTVRPDAPAGPRGDAPAGQADLPAGPPPGSPEMDALHQRVRTLETRMDRLREQLPGGRHPAPEGAGPRARAMSGGNGLDDKAVREEVARLEKEIWGHRKTIDDAEAAYAAHKQKLGDLMEQGYHGKKPEYENTGHHDPTSPNFRGRGDTTTPLPADADGVYDNAIPDPDAKGRTWWGRGDNGDYYRYQATPDGKYMHWNGATGNSGGGRAIRVDDVPSHVRRRFELGDTKPYREAVERAHGLRKPLAEYERALDTTRAEAGYPGTAKGLHDAGLRDQIDDLVLGGEGGFPRLTRQNTEVLRNLAPDRQVQVELRGTGEPAQWMSVKDAVARAHADPNVTDLHVRGVASRGAPLVDAKAVKDRFPDGWIDGFDGDLSQAVQGATVRFDSGDVGAFFGTPQMLRELASSPNVRSIARGEPPGWVRPVSEMPVDHRLVGHDPVAARLGQLGPEAFGRAADVRGLEVRHGTVQGLADSVRAGPKDVGKGFGGQGLYLFTKADADLAGHYSTFARDAAGARAREAGQAIAGPDAAKPVVLEGRIADDAPLRVGRFTLTQGGAPDLANGRLPWNWAEDPVLSQALLRRFDVLDMRGAQAAGLNLATDRFLVMHASAGADALRWAD